MWTMESKGIAGEREADDYRNEGKDREGREFRGVRRALLADRKLTNDGVSYNGDAASI